jgi:hypothetical protein
MLLIQELKSRRENSKKRSDNCRGQNSSKKNIELVLKTVVTKLMCFYTNAHRLRNKMSEFHERVHSEN